MRASPRKTREVAVVAVSHIAQSGNHLGRQVVPLAFWAVQQGLDIPHKNEASPQVGERFANGRMAIVHESKGFLVFQSHAQLTVKRPQNILQCQPEAVLDAAAFSVGSNAAKYGWFGTEKSVSPLKTCSRRC